MLLFIIDGFNLTHAIDNISRGADKGFKFKNSSTPQQDLIHYIKARRLTGSRNNKVIIVFDGYQPQAGLTDSGFKIIFSGSLSADQLIIEEIKQAKKKSETLVVSDDRQIRDAARKQRARSLRTADFVKPDEKPKSPDKDISYPLQREITEELRKIWLKE
jgi:hypothetical protein